MAAMSAQPPVVRVKPQQDIYTLLLILSVLALAAAIALVAHNLMTVYGMSFGQLFTGQKVPV